MRAGKIRVELELDDGRFVQRVVRAGTTIKEMERTVRGSIKSVERLDKKTRGFGRTLRDVTVTVGLARAALENLHLVTTGLVASVIRANAEIERMQMLFRGMSDQTDTADAIREANEQVEHLFELAKKAPFSIQALGDAMVKMKAGGIDPMAGGMRALTNAVAAFGGNDQDLHRAAVAIQQMGGKSAISMEELRQQLGESVPQAMNMMARATGMSMNDMVQLISRGGLEAKTALDRMFFEMNLVYEGAAERMMSTWNGLFARLRTTVMEFQYDIGNAGGGGGKLTFFETMKYQLGELIALLESPVGAQWATTIGESLKQLTEAVVDAVKWVRRYSDEIITLAKVFGGLYVMSRVLGIMKNMKGGLVDLIGGYREFNNQIDRITRKTRGSIAVMGRAAGRNGFMAVRRNALRASRAVRTIGIAFRTLAGPIGFIITTAILLWIERLISFKSQIEETEDAWRRMRDGMAEDGDGSAIKTDVERTQQYIEDLKRINELLKDRKNIDGLKHFTGDSRLSSVADADQDLLALLQNYNPRYTDMQNPGTTERVIEQVQAAIARAEKRGHEMRLEQEKLFNDQLQREGRHLADLKLDRVRRETEDTQRIYNEHIGKLHNLLSSGQIDQEQYFKDQIVIRKAALQTNMDLIDQEISLETKRLAALKEGTAAYVASQQKITELNEMWERYSTLLQSTEKMSTPAKTLLGDGDDNKDLQRFDSTLVSLRSRLADMKAETKGASGELAKLQSKLDSGAFGPIENIDTEKLAEAKRLAVELDKAAERLKAKREIDKVFEGLADRTRQVDVNLKEAKAAFDGDWTSTGLRTLERQLAKLRRQLEEFGDPNLLKQFDTAAGEIRRNQANAEVYETARAWKEKTATIRGALATTLEERRKHANAALEVEIARIRQAADRFKGSEEEKRRIVAMSEEYIRALRDETARQNEGAFKRSLRAWQDTSEAMEQAAVSWTDSWIDGVIEAARTGKMEFGRMAEAIIADILKIQMRAMIANQVLGQGGSSGSGIFGGIVKAIAGKLGGWFGTGTSVSQSGMTQAGSATTSDLNAYGLYHTGGIVGKEAGQLRLASASLFATAKKFHSGGMPGLRSDEVPAILQKGEGVFTKEQMKALGGHGDVTVNVINQTGQKVQAQQSGGPRFDGERMVLDVVLKAASRPGSFREGLKGALSQ